MGNFDSKVGALPLPESRIAAWRAHVATCDPGGEAAAARLEAALRGTLDELLAAGVAGDEAFLVALRRLSAEHAPTADYVGRNLARIWGRPKAPERRDGGGPGRFPELAIVLSLAVVAGASAKLAGLFEPASGEGVDSFYLRNVTFFSFPWLAAYLLWKRQAGLKEAALIAGAFFAACALMNTYPFEVDGMTTALAGLHMPIALWLVVGMAFAGSEWSAPGRRMDFVRFSGGLVICFVLIALGGGALTGLTVVLFQSIGLNADHFAERWILPCGACGATVVSAWLGSVQSGMVRGMASLLARVFTPLLSVALLGFLVAMAWTGQGINVEREVLVAFDVILVLVVCLLLYSLASSAGGQAPARRWTDRLQLLLVVCALLVDGLALGAIVGRISEYGASANKLAALAVNLILLVNLAWTGWLYARYLRGQSSREVIEGWQVKYLPVYSAWAAVVVVIFPPLFRYS